MKKVQGEKAWKKKHRSKELIETIREDLQLRSIAEARAKSRNQFFSPLPNPEAYINQDRWTDEHDVQVPAKAAARKKEQCGNLRCIDGWVWNDSNESEPCPKCEQGKRHRAKLEGEV